VVSYMLWLIGGGPRYP